MIELRAMTPTEFQDYVAYFVPDYAAEISSNYDVDMDAALAQAQAAIKDDLAQGVETAGHDLMCITVQDHNAFDVVGYAWCKTSSGNDAVFISDFYVKPTYRGRGYARAALAALDLKYSADGYETIGLRVAADNERAQRLYLAAGYKPTGINMRKALPPS